VGGARGGGEMAVGEEVGIILTLIRSSTDFFFSCWWHRSGKLAKQLSTIISNNNPKSSMTDSFVPRSPKADMGATETSCPCKISPPRMLANRESRVGSQSRSFDHNASGAVAEADVSGIWPANAVRETLARSSAG